MELKDTREIDSYFTYDGSRAHKFSADKFVTENGCVYSLRKGTAPVQIAMTPNKGGYLPLRYTNKDGTAVYTSVHQRVAQSFIDNPSNFEVVDHINENKVDNRAINLRWTTLKGNTDYAFTRLLYQLFTFEYFSTIIVPCQEPHTNKEPVPKSLRVQALIIKNRCFTRAPARASGR